MGKTLIHQRWIKYSFFFLSLPLQILAGGTQKSKKLNPGQAALPVGGLGPLGRAAALVTPGHPLPLPVPGGGAAPVRRHHLQERVRAQEIQRVGAEILGKNTGRQRYRPPVRRPTSPSLELVRHSSVTTALMLAARSEFLLSGSVMSARRRSSRD